MRLEEGDLVFVLLGKLGLLIDIHLQLHHLTHAFCLFDAQTLDLLADLLDYFLLLFHVLIFLG